MLRISGARFWPLFAVVLLAVIGLSATVLDTDDLAAEPPNDPAATYRRIARDAYEHAFTESCEPDPRWERRVVLASERAALEIFQNSLQGEGRRFQMSIAQADVEHAMRTDRLGCSVDDPEFAAMHVERARSEVVRAITRLRWFDQPLSDAAPVDTLPKATAAAYRAEVRDLVEPLHPRCRIVSFQKDDRVLASARTRVSDYRRTLDGTAYALHFDIAAADVILERRTGIPECGSARSMSLQAASHEYEAAAVRQIAVLAGYNPRHSSAPSSGAAA